MLWILGKRLMRYGKIKFVKTSEEFRNSFMDIFSEDTFEHRRQYITGFYLNSRENLERDYPYLNEIQTEAFVKKTVKIIMNHIEKLNI